MISKTEELIQEDKARTTYQQIFESSGNALLYLEPVMIENSLEDFEILFLNESAKRLTSLEERSWIKRDYFLRSREARISKLLGECIKVYQEKTEFQDDKLFPLKDGKRWMRINIRRTGGGIIISIADIHLLKSATEKLSNIRKKLTEQEEMYKQLFDKSLDPIFLTTPEFLITDFNNAMVELLGYEKTELLSLNLKNLIASESDFYELTNKLSRDSWVKQFAVKLVSANGKEIPCGISLAEIEVGNSKFQIYQGIIHDMTLRKKLESESLITEKIALTNKMARSIAHEVRNPLTNLSLALEQLQAEIPETESTGMYLDIIKRNAKRVDDLITEVLNSSGPGTLQLKFENINEAISNSLSLANDRAELEEIVIERHLEKNIPDIPIDRKKIEVALLNIFINAIESMKPSVGVLTVGSSLNNEYVEIRIQDNGKGIEHKNLKDLFDPYFTLKKSGMGLGLTTVRNIIKAHKGDIEVQSEVGKGTCFTIYLPLEQKKS